MLQIPFGFFGEYAWRVKLKSYVRKLQYQTTFLSFFVNQGYLIRKVLWNEIRKYASSANGKILDFGCGSKPYEKAFSICESYTGLDIEISGHNHANSRIDILYDGKEIPFPNKTFDKVVCFEVFEHIPDPDNSLEEVSRVLKAGGELFISIPFMYGEHEIPFDFQRWTSFGLRNLVEKHNFRVVKLVKLNANLGIIAQLFFDQIFLKQNAQWLTKANILKVPFIPLANFIVLIFSMIPARNENLYSNLVCIAVKNNLDVSNDENVHRLEDYLN